MKNKNIKQLQQLLLLRRLIAYLLVCTFLLLIPSLALAGETTLVYDDAGNIIKIISDSGDESILAYDEKGNLMSITNNFTSQGAPITTDASGNAKALVYDSEGNLIEILTSDTGNGKEVDPEDGKKDVSN